MPQSSLFDWLRPRTTVATPLPITSSDNGATTPPSLGIPAISKAQTECAPTSPTSKVPQSLKTRGPHPPALPQLPSNATIEPCTEEHIKSMRKLNALLLPIPYQDSFYKETLNDPTIASLTQVALWKDHAPTGNTADINPPQHLVASIRCRLLSCPPNDPSQDTPILYISTITTLAPFRRHALASHLLDVVTRTAVQSYGVTAVMAHVWEAHEESMAWYKKRGFRVVGKVEDYYRRLAPQTAAFLIRRDVGPMDVLGWEMEGTVRK